MQQVKILCRREGWSCKHTFECKKSVSKIVERGGRLSWKCFFVYEVDDVLRAEMYNIIDLRGTPLLGIRAVLEKRCK